MGKNRIKKFIVGVIKMIKKEDKLREKLNKYIEMFGTNDERTLEVSQQLDPYMTEGQLQYGTN